MARSYLDSQGQPVGRGDHVNSFGYDGVFQVEDLRPEGVAVIRNLAPGFRYTSTVPLRVLRVLACGDRKNGCRHDNRATGEASDADR